VAAGPEAASSHSPNAKPEGPKSTQDKLPKTRWEAFCHEWNETAGRAPVAIGVLWNGAASLTWFGSFLALSSLPFFRSLLGMPEIAAGWLVMRLTRRFRMPIDLAVAAALSQLFPKLALLKVSPLLKIFIVDEESKKEMAKTSEKLSPSTLSAIEKFSRGFKRFAAWVEGPVDKYGLSYFLTAKVSNVSTLVLATIAVSHGIDLPGILSSWGLSTAVQAESGIVAGAAAWNVLLTPLHFWCAVASVQHLEAIGSSLWIQGRLELAKKQELKLELDETDKVMINMKEEELVASFLRASSMVAILVQLGFAGYMMVRLGRSMPQESKEINGEAPLAATTDQVSPEADSSRATVSATDPK